MDKDKRDDLNANGIDDEIEPPGVDVTAGTKQLADRLQNNQGTNPTLSGGDIDARWEDAESGGDETVGGSTATPGRERLGCDRQGDRRNLCGRRGVEGG